MNAYWVHHNLAYGENFHERIELYITKLNLSKDLSIKTTQTN